MTDFIDERLAKAEARTPRLVKALDESSTVATLREFSWSDPLATYSDARLADALEEYFNLTPRLPIVTEAIIRLRERGKDER
jgi:hypothetical protein